MKLSDYDYALPQELIAAHPLEDRAAARLIRVDRKTGTLSHHTFREIQHFLEPGDLLVLNDTKVIPARIFGRKRTGGKVEALLLKEQARGEWEALLRPGGRIKKGTVIQFGENGVRLEAEVLEDSRADSAGRRLRFSPPAVREMLEKIGHTPLPPYIGRRDTEADKVNYQTVFAQNPGAVASPTAGLHFDRELLDVLLQKGIEIVTVTLHVGYGTFQTIPCEDLSRHQMLEEEFEVTESSAEKINRAISGNRRIIACGTTVVRTLESAAISPHPAPLPRGEGKEIPSPLREKARMRVKVGSGKTKLFIYPPYPFKIVDGLITNFHLPKSTLLLLTAAFLAHGAGARHAPPLLLLDIYREAARRRYRFYSYGDAMLIL